MSTEKKVLLVCSDYYGPFYEDSSKTGAYFTEVLHPFQVFTKAGYSVQIVSENGNVG